jgi:hypothetical protein
MNGRFEDYRQLRAEAALTRSKDFSRQIAALAPSQIIAALPLHPTTSDQPMIATALRTLHDRPLEVDSGQPYILDATIDYAVRHELRPLDGIAAAVTEHTWASPYARAQLARALGRASAAEEIGAPAVRPPRGESKILRGAVWDGFCGPDICQATSADVAGPLSITIQNAMSDEVPPYVECYVDDALAWEGAVSTPVNLALVPHHRIEIRLVNPLTRNRGSRRIRIS